MNRIPLHIEDASSIPLCIGEDSSIPLGFDGAMYAAGVPYYDGEYEITPSPETQVLRMKDLRAADDVTVRPIPSNYGLITWNGSVITVS